MSENPIPGASRMCESHARGGVGWSGLELTDTLNHVILGAKFGNL